MLQHSVPPGRPLAAAPRGPWLAALALLWVPSAPAPSAQPTTAPFGFRALEIFKTESNALGLQAVDVNGDGLVDLVLANNAEGTIELRLQRPASEIAAAGEAGGSPGSQAPPSKPIGRENEVDSDPRFRVEKLYTERVVTSLAVADFNGDSRPDVAYYGRPAELVVLYQGDVWGTERAEFPIRDGSQSPYALGTADLDGDGRADLILLAKSKTYLLLQKEGGGLGQPVEIPNSFEETMALEALDIDGDDRLDLIGFAPSREEPVTVRRQGEGGFGPEVVFRLRPITSWCVAPLATRAGAPPRPTLLVVRRSSRRLEGLCWRRSPSPSGLGPPHLLALGAGAQSDTSRRLLADVDGDGRTDVLVSYPEEARIGLTFQDASGQLSRRAVYPSLAGVVGLDVGDVDGDGKVEVVVVSRKEKAIGLSRWDGGRLTFPRTWPLDAEPSVVAVGPLRGPAGDPSDPASPPAPDCVFLVVKRDGQPHLLVFRVGTDGERSVLADMQLELEDPTPSALRVLDADDDGDSDLLVFVPYEAPHLLRQEPGAAGEGESEGGLLFRDISRDPDFGLGQLAKLRPSALTTTRWGRQEDGETTAMLVASKSYVRALRLSPDGRLEVLDQLGARGEAAQIDAAVLIDVDGEAGREAVLFDRSSMSLEILHRRSDSTFELTASVPIPRLELVEMTARDLNGDGREDLALIGKKRIAVLHVERDAPGLEPALQYSEEDHEDIGQPADLTVGDLNGDGTADVVVSTSPRYRLAFLALESEDGAEPKPGSRLVARKRCTFPVFEEKSYMRRSSGNFGPRQMVVRDMDADGLEDLLLLIHDRILLYLQDDLRGAAGAAASPASSDRTNR